MKKGWIWLISGLLLVGLLLPVSCQKSEPAQTIHLDTFANVNNNGKPQPWNYLPQFSDNSLTKGKTYLVTIKGTFSVWSYTDWTNSLGTSGAPEQTPMFTSPGTTNGQVGWDMEYVFGVPNDTNPTTPTPYHQTAIKISLNNGATWSHIEPITSGYRSDHTYQYRVVGVGEKIGIRLEDGAYDDNYGILEMEIKAQ